MSEKERPPEEVSAPTEKYQRRADPVPSELRLHGNPYIHNLSDLEDAAADAWVLYDILTGQRSITWLLYYMLQTNPARAKQATTEMQGYLAEARIHEWMTASEAEATGSLPKSSIN